MLCVTPLLISSPSLLHGLLALTVMRRSDFVLRTGLVVMLLRTLGVSLLLMLSSMLLMAKLLVLKGLRGSLLQVPLALLLVHGSTSGLSSVAFIVVAFALGIRRGSAPSARERLLALPTFDITLMAILFGLLSRLPLVLRI